LLFLNWKIFRLKVSLSCDIGFDWQLTLGLCAGVALEFLPPEQMPGF